MDNVRENIHIFCYCYRFFFLNAYVEKGTTIYTDGWKAYQKITKLLTPVIAEWIYSSRETLSVWKGLPKAILQLLEFQVDIFSSKGFFKLSDGLSWIPAVLNRKVAQGGLIGFNLKIISQSWDMSQTSFETNPNLRNKKLTALNGRISRYVNWLV